MPPFLRHYLVTCLLQLRVYSVEPTCAPNRSELILSAHPSRLGRLLYAVGPHLRPYPVRPYPICTPLTPPACSSTLSGHTYAPIRSAPILSARLSRLRPAPLRWRAPLAPPYTVWTPLPDQPLAAEREIAVPRDNQMIQQTNIEQSRRLRNTFGQHLVLSTRGGSSRRMIMDQNELRGQ